ncbi:MAG: zf-HC2 domain-containing protein [Halieaceae bacterium]|nr:zf-HC2 domain-containing protein [Halieaceae bacterium]
MSQTDLEQISRYLDNEMSPAERVEVEQRCASEPAFKALLEESTALNISLKTTFTAPGTDAVPPKVAAMLGTTNNNVIAFPQRTQRTQRTQFAIAASVAAICGVLIAQNTAFQSAGSPDLLNDDLLLSQALETSPSMAKGWQILDDGRQLRPVLTFPSTSGQWCREYLLSAEEQDWRGVACRQDSGEWVTQALGTEAFLNPGDAYQPAGAGDSDKVATFIGENAADIALGRNAESTLIANGWR